MRTCTRRGLTARGRASARSTRSALRTRSRAPPRAAATRAASEERGGGGGGGVGGAGAHEVRGMAWLVCMHRLLTLLLSLMRGWQALHRRR